MIAFFRKGAGHMDFSREIPDQPEMFSHERTLLRPDKRGICGLRELVRVNFVSQLPRIAEHIHPDAMEICYYSKGTQVYSVGGGDYCIKGGMVFVTYPNEVHSSGGNRQEKGGQLFYMIIDTVNSPERLLGLDSDDALHLAAALNALPRTFHVGAEVKALCDGIFDICAAQPFCWRTRLRMGAFELLCELIRCAERRESAAVSPEIIRALDYIEDRIREGGRISIANIAGSAHFSAPQLNQRFLSEIGETPGQYINRRRTELAMALLSEGASVTETALRLGFASSQHFSSFFRSYTGCSPTQWRRSSGAATRPGG